MAVDPERRGRGIGSRLGTAFLEDMRRRGLPSVRVVVGAENGPAIRAYERLGFLRKSTTQVHPGEPSEVMEWSG
jgi:mycothiol synthase